MGLGAAEPPDDEPPEDELSFFFELPHAATASVTAKAMAANRRPDVTCTTDPPG